MKDEPVLTIITGFVTATIGLLAAFGLDFTTEQVTAIAAFVAAAYTMAILIRSKVTPVRSREDVAAVIESSRRR